jgi:hypothetical protein
MLDHYGDPLGSMVKTREDVDLYLDEPFGDAAAFEWKRERWGTGVDAQMQEARFASGDFTVPTYGED